MTLLARRLGDGPPLVLIHGFTVDHRLLLPLDDAFAGWTRLYLDLPGHGGTPGDGVNGSDDVASAVVRWLEAEVPGPFAVVGNSWGGLIARQVVAELPGRVLGLALLAPMVKVPGERRLPQRVVLRTDEAFLATLPEPERADFASVAIEQTPAEWELFRETVLPGVRAHDEAAEARISARYGIVPVPESRFATFDGPSLLVTGRQDDQVGWEDQQLLLPSYPRMTSVVLDRAGHNAHTDRLDVVKALLKDWLNRLSPG